MKRSERPINPDTETAAEIPQPAQTDIKTETRTAVALKVVEKAIAAEILSGKERLHDRMEEVGAKVLVAKMGDTKIGTVMLQDGREGGAAIVNETQFKAHLREHLDHVLVETIDPSWVKAHMKTYAEEWAEDHGGDLPPGVEIRPDGADFLVVNPNVNAREVVLEAIRGGELSLLPQ